MKYEITKSKKKEFEPFTVQITVENLSELKGLWARFNLPTMFKDGGPKANGANMNTYSLWKEIDKELEKYL